MRFPIDVSKLKRSTGVTSVATSAWTPRPSRTAIKNASEKSWLTPAEEQAGWDAIRAIYELTDSYWANSRTYAEAA